jgi:Xaa-Pro aminopeptidase
MLSTVEPPRTTQDEYRSRRDRVGQRVGDSALVLYGGELRTRSEDTEFRFRPDSDFYYLTGLREPGAVLVLRPGREPELVLFVRPRDAEAEVWSGRRIGPEGAKALYGADEAHPLTELRQRLPALLDGVPAVHVPLGRWRRLDGAVVNAMDRLRRRNRWGDAPPAGVMDGRLVLGEDRMHKDEAALRSLRHAVELSARAHVAAMQAVRPGRHEYEIEALIEHEFRRQGSTGPGYATIVGGGENATVLHYVENADRLHADQLLLVDAGCEWELFSGDITRTYPIAGRFTAAQRSLYEIVLAANLAGIAEVVVGSDIERIHRRCLTVLCEGLVELGLLSGSVEQLIEEKQYERYYMHRSSHWLGADVHDAGKYTFSRKPRPLEPGFVLTVEPGLYVAASDDKAPAELRGTGIRIEDDVLVTEAGPEVLSHQAPKRPEALEEIVGGRS